MLGIKPRYLGSPAGRYTDCIVCYLKYVVTKQYTSTEHLFSISTMEQSDYTTTTEEMGLNFQ
jgi:hypothetical protein